MDHVSKDKRSAIMAKVKGVNTTPEILLRKYLFGKGYRYRKNDKRFPGKPDIFIPKYRIAIFIHGCFWHGHNCKFFRMPKSNVAYWQKKIEGNMHRDVTNLQKNKEMGIKVITVWECELREAKSLNSIYNQLTVLQNTK